MKRFFLLSVFFVVRIGAMCIDEGQVQSVQRRERINRIEYLASFSNETGILAYRFTIGQDKMIAYAWQMLYTESGKRAFSRLPSDCYYMLEALYKKRLAELPANL